jgi:hypothetical protein
MIRKRNTQKIQKSTQFHQNKQDKRDKAKQYKILKMTKQESQNIIDITFSLWQESVESENQLVISPKQVFHSLNHTWCVDPKEKEREKKRKRKGKVEKIKEK